MIIYIHRHIHVYIYVRERYKYSNYCAIEPLFFLTAAPPAFFCRGGSVVQKQMPRQRHVTIYVYYPHLYFYEYKSLYMSFCVIIYFLNQCMCVISACLRDRGCARVPPAQASPFFFAPWSFRSLAFSFSYHVRGTFAFGVGF